jgi:hypothetical protein
MRPSRSIAVWLSECLGLDTALNGDLLEERARGRSAIWYWRQVLFAAGIAFRSGVRENKLLAMRALATGFAAEYVFAFAFERWGVDGPNVPPVSIARWIAFLSEFLLAQTAVGWIVARTHRTHGSPMVMAFLISLVLSSDGPWVFRIGSMLAHGDRLPYSFLGYCLFPVTFLMVLGILLGGVILDRPNHSLRGL